MYGDFPFVRREFNIRILSNKPSTNIEIEHKLGTYHSQKEEKKDTIHVFVIKPKSKEFKQQGEIEGAQWFDLDNLPENMSEATLRRIAEYKKGKRMGW